MGIKSIDYASSIQDVPTVDSMKWRWQLQLDTPRNNDSTTKPHACSYCSYRAFLKSDITKHQRIHTGEKPYQCKICSYVTARQDSLIRHQRIHTGEKPYHCVQCEYKATSNSALQSHVFYKHNKSGLF